MLPTLIFDYDGTIHNTMKIYQPALQKTCSWLVEKKYTEIARIGSLSQERVASWLGMNSKEMWNDFLPDLPEEIKEKASAMVGNFMADQVKAHRAIWYSGIREVLDILRAQGWTMVILSNCKTSYARAHWEEFNMGQWFTAFYDCETYHFAPKTEIISEIQKSFSGPYLVIGDRESDLACAKVSKSPFIGCRYGFGEEGELAEADYLADQPQQILEGISQNLYRLR